MAIFTRRVRTGVRIGAILALFAGAFLLSREHLRSSHGRIIRKTEIMTASGERIERFFNGLPREKNFDLKEIVILEAQSQNGNCSKAPTGFWGLLIEKKERYLKE